MQRRSPVLKVSLVFLLPLRRFICLPISPQSASFGSFAVVQSAAFVGHVSSVAPLQRNEPLATVLWCGALQRAPLAVSPSVALMVEQAITSRCLGNVSGALGELLGEIFDHLFPCS